jgi:hypothetical protein
MGPKKKRGSTKEGEAKKLGIQKRKEIIKDYVCVYVYMYVCMYGSQDFRTSWLPNLRHKQHSPTKCLFLVKSYNDQ